MQMWIKYTWENANVNKIDLGSSSQSWQSSGEDRDLTDTEEISAVHCDKCSKVCPLHPFPVVVRVLTNLADRNAVIAHSISTSAVLRVCWEVFQVVRGDQQRKEVPSAFGKYSE